MFNFRFQLATGNVKKSAKSGHYHYQFYSFPIGSQTGSWTCAHIEVKNKLYPFSNFGWYRITTLGKNDYFGFCGGKWCWWFSYLLLRDESQDRFDAFKIILDIYYIGERGWFSKIQLVKKITADSLWKIYKFFSNFRLKSSVIFYKALIYGNQPRSPT